MVLLDSNIQGEGFTPSSMPSPRLRAMVPEAIAAMEVTPSVEEEERAFRFCRLFPDLEKFRPHDAGLIALGQALADPGSGDSQIPAGFTYLGQFTTTSLSTAPPVCPPVRWTRRRSSRGGRPHLN
jgi:hypothetical protein